MTSHYTTIYASTIILFLNWKNINTIKHAWGTVIKQCKKGQMERSKYSINFVQKPNSDAVICTIMKLHGMVLTNWQAKLTGPLLISAKSSTDFPNIWKGIQRNSYNCYPLTDGFTTPRVRCHEIKECTRDHWIILKGHQRESPQP